MYRDIIGQEIRFKGHNGAEKVAYFSKPAGPGPFPAVVFIHHIPGWNEVCIETVRRFAHHGYMAISHNLYTEYGEGDADDIGARARADGGVSDEQMLGDTAGAAAYLKSQKESNGKVGVMGYCWGGRVMVKDKSALTAKQPVAPIDYAKDLSCPILGLFGNDDKEPDPDQVNKTEEILKGLGKTYEFHRYDGAGHAFFDWSRPSYRPEQAMDGWKKVFGFFGKHLS